jgi:flavin reductase (DIM6/NTAB) family NADH-FMN oxidoreductase RutF
MDFWLLIEFDSPCNSSSRLNLSYNGVILVFSMNAAWGTMLDRDMVALNLTETHRTVQNIKARKGFVVHIADAKHVVEADWFGVVSGSKEPRSLKNPA